MQIIPHEVQGHVDTIPICQNMLLTPSVMCAPSQLLDNWPLASNFQTRERAKSANSSLDQVDTKMISEVFINSDAKW